MSALTLLRLLSLRQFRRKPLRCGLTMASVALGVALLVAGRLANQATLRSFEQTVNAVAGKAKLSVTAGEAGFPAAVADSILSVKSVWYAVPRIEARTSLAGKKEAAEPLMVLGLDFFLEARGQFQTTTGAVSTGGLRELFLPDTVVLTHTFADRHGLGLRSRVLLATPNGVRPFVVRSILTPVGIGQAYGGSVAMMNLAAAREHFGKPGKVDRFDLLTVEGADLDRTARELEAKLGTGYTVQRTEMRTRAFERTVRSFQACLSLFSAMALFLACFLVASSVEFSIARRAREIAVLRALGATRGMVAGVFAVEGLVIGAAGSALGVPGGSRLAAFLVGAVERSIEGQYHLPVALSVVSMTRGEAAFAALAGIGIAVVAALVPALRALRPASPEGNRVPAVAGALALAALALSSRWLESPLLKLPEPVLALLPSVCLAPFLFQRAAGALAVAVRRGPLLLTLRYLSRLPARTANSVRGIAVGFSIVVLIAGINASLKGSLLSFYRKTLHADLIVSSFGRVIDYSTAPLSESLGARLAAVPGVREGGVEGVRFTQAAYEGQTIALKAFDRPAPDLGYSIFDTRDRPPAEAGPELFAARDSVMVSDSFARRFKKKRGDSVELATPGGRRPFAIVAVVTDFVSPIGVLYLSRDRYKRYWDDPLVTRFNVRVAPGSDPARVRQVIETGLGARWNVMATAAGEIRRQVVETVDRGFAFAGIFETLVLLVALLGLGNSMQLAVLERTRELGCLRAAGMTRGQLFRMTLREAFLIGAGGGALGTAIGGALAYVWISGTLTHLLGWRIEFGFPWREALLGTLTAAAVATLAGVVPSLRAARLDVRSALAAD